MATKSLTTLNDYLLIIIDLKYKKYHMVWMIVLCAGDG